MKMYAHSPVKDDPVTDNPAIDIQSCCRQTILLLTKNEIFTCSNPH